MNNKFKFFPLCLFSISLLTGCSLEARPEDTTALMTAINYADNTRITYQGDDEYYTPGWDEAMLASMKAYDDAREHEPGYKRLFDRASAPRKLSKGDYKPVFNAIQNRLGIKLLEHQGAACSGEKKSVSYFRDNWLSGPYADMSMGTVYAITNYSVAGDHETILDLKPYLDQTEFDWDVMKREWKINPEHPGCLPHIALFLKNNSAIKMSVTTAKHSHHNQGAIYYIPYFDGFDDLEKTTIVRADYIKRVLDDDPNDLTKPFSEDNTILGKDGKYKKNFEPCYRDQYEPTYAPTYTIDYPFKDEQTGAWTAKQFDKKGGVENIILQQNRLIDENKATSKNLALQFRNYIDQRYRSGESETGKFFDNYSDLFLGDKACYDADELVALMRLIKVSSGTIFGKDASGKLINKEMITMMPRELDNSNSADLYRWAGQLFGYRGFESRNDYLYLTNKTYYRKYGDFREYDLVHDCRGDETTVEMLKKLNNLYKEGLILQDFDTNTATGTPNGKFCDDTIIAGGSDNYASFMIYDYVNFSDKFNRDNKSKQWKTYSHGYNLRPMITAVAKWETGEDGPFEPHDGWMQFTESWCSIKTSGLCLNAKLPETPAKLEAAFKFVDYIYSDEGKYLYNYGPYEDGYMYPFNGTNYDKIFNYVEYQGKKIPKFTPTALKYNEDSNHLRRKVGATIPFSYEKLKGMEFQNYTDQSKEGVEKINKSIEAGSLKHVLTDYDFTTTKAFYKIVPSAFFLTTGQSSAIANLRDKAKLGSIFTDSSQNNFNIWDSYVMGKKSSIAPELDDYLNTINNKWELPKLVKYYQSGYEMMA